MADIKTNQSKLYKALQGAGFKDLGSEQQFAAKLQDAGNRQKLYKALQKQGFKDLGDYNSFEGRIYEAPKEGAEAVPVAQPTKQETPQEAAPAPAKVQQKPQGYKPTEQEMMAFNMGINSALGTAEYSKKSFEKTAKNLETYSKQNPLGGGTRGTAKADPKWNPETGKMEQTYISSAGTEHQYQHQAEEMSDLQWRDLHPMEAAEREMRGDLRDIRREEELNTERRKDSEGRKDPKDKTWWDYFKESFATSAVTAMQPMGGNMDRDMIEAQMIRSGAYGSERQAIAKESDVLMARKRLAQDALNLLSDARKDQSGYSILGGLKRAGEKVLETALDPHTWDFGEADLASQMAVADAVIKMDSGLGVSDNERKLLDTWAKNAAINSQFADQLSGWTKAGVVTGESLPFMLEMAMNPASGLGQAATTQMVKYSLKKYGTKWVKDHAKSMLAKKIATRLIGDVVGSGIMATTTGWARVASDAESRMTGQVDIGLDANGDVIYQGVKDKESPAAAIFKGLSATAIENWSEMAGEYFGFINNFFGKALGKTVVGKAGRKMLAETGSIEGVSLNKAQKFIYELAAGKGIGAFSQTLKQFADRTQWHGVIGEYLEEEVGNIANAIVVGDMTLDTAKDTGVFNLQQNIDTFCGVALMGGFMSTLHTAGFVAHKVNYDVDRVSNANAKLFGDEFWNRIKTTIDSSIGDPRGLNDALTDLLGGDDAVFDTEGKKAILKYAQAALEKQGAEMAQYQPRMQSSTINEVTADGQKQYVVTSLDKNGDAISQQAFETEDEAKAYEGELKMRQQQQDYKDFLGMTNKLSYPEATQVVDEILRSLREFGLEGSDTYAAALAAVNDPKTDLGKRFLQLKTERILQKAERNRQAIEEFEAENGWTPGTVAWLAEQDPMQMDAEGLQMADQARTFLEGLAYPSNEVHVEHEQQVGSEIGGIVVGNVISLEEPIDPMNNAGQQLQEQWNAVQQARNDLFARNEDLMQEVTRMEMQYLSPQEILSSLDSFSEADRQVLTDYYNTQARYDSMLDEANKKIVEAAQRNRERRTFKGTINGQPNDTELITLSDGEGGLFTLVSGNITTNQEGVITGSNSGLIIAVDQNGDFVQFKDTSMMSIVTPMGGNMTLDEYESAEIQRLQEEVTSVIDPNGTLGQGQAENGGFAPTKPGDSSEESGGSQGGTIEPEGSPVTPTTPQNPPSPAGVAAPVQPQQPAVSIESVTDKDGIKRYENGVTAEDAVMDMVQSGDNPIEIADASIAEAELAIKKINDKPTKTRKDLADRKRHEATKKYYEDLKNTYSHVDRADGSSYTRIGDRAILEKDGKIVYDTAGILGPVFPTGMQEQIRLESEENVNVEPQQPQSAGNVVPSQPKLTVEEQKQERIKALKAELGEFFDDDFTKANDVLELVSMWLSRKRNLAWDDVNGKRGLQKELGWTRKIGGDTKYIETMLAKKGEGVGVDEFVHSVWESPENSVGEEKRWTTEEIKEALLDLLKSAQSKSDVVDYAVNTREAQARQALAEEQKRAEEEAQNPTEEEVEPLTDEELKLMLADMPFGMPTDEDIPDAPIVQLQKVIDELNQQEGMPRIRLIDTDRMSNDEWYDITSGLYGGAFVSQQQIDEVRNNALVIGVAYNEEEGEIVVFSYGQTAEQVRNKIRYIYEEITKLDSVPEEGRNNRGDSIVPGNESETSQRAEGEVAANVPTGSTRGGRLDSENGSREQGAQGEGLPNSGRGTETDGLPSVDPYLQPRDAEEEQIIAEVEGQLQSEIADAVKDRDRAASALQKARAKESDRATDIFSDDEAFQQPDQLFSFDEMGGTDRTQEGVNRRTQAEQDALNTAQNRLDQLQSPQERNSRVRGALDNHRRQTSFGDNAQLTPEEIDSSSFPKQVKTLAKAYLNGNHGELQTAAYQDIFDEVRGEQPETPASEPQQPITTNNPMEAIAQAADSFRAEQQSETEEEATAKVKGVIDAANGKRETPQQKRERLKAEILAKAEALKKAQIKNLREDMGKMGMNRLTPSFIPRDKEQRKLFWEMVQSTAEYGYTYIQEGVTNFDEWRKRLYDDIVSTMREIFAWWGQKEEDGYIDAVWNSEVEDNGETKTLAEWAGEKPNNSKEGDNSVNEHKEKNNEPNKVVSSQQKESRDAFVTAVRSAMLDALRTGEKPFKSINDLRTLAQQSGMEIDKDGRDDILLQELTELALVSAARETITKKHNGGFTSAAYKDIVKLYKMQPAINQRSSNRIKMQQYSTPLPMSFVAQMFADNEGEVFEPTAGNGMLVFGIAPQRVTVNELDGTRLGNLQEQGFGMVTNQDATQPFEGNEQYDAVIANPPFGSAEAKEYDGKMIPGLAEQIALNALSKMKDNGRAAIIIGENMKYADNGAINRQKAFFTYLYDHYNVKGVIDMDGSLYARQGTTYPTRMILIDGRRSEEERAQTKVYPPVRDKAPRKAETFSDLFEIVTELSNNENKTNGNEVLRTSGPSGLSDSSNTRGQADTKRRSEQSDANGTDGRSGDTRRTRGTETTRTDGQRTEQQPTGVVSGQTGTGGLSAVSGQQSVTNRGGTGTDNGTGRNVGDTRRNEPARPGTEQAGRQRNEGVENKPAIESRPTNEEKRELGSDKLPYRPHNGAFSLESVAPAAMVEAMDKTLQKIEKEYGNIDSFVTSELGYDTIEDMHNALAAEQVDSVAMAIWNMKNCEGMVIGDQTGVGKGRQMAALIRWAVRQGKKPVFVTKDADLFSDIYRDLVDIGSGDLRPFIFNAGVTITDANGIVVHKSLSDATQKKVLAMKELPEGFDFAILSYPQMNTGDAISQEESGKAAKDRGERGKKGKAVKNGRPTPKADFLRRIAKDNYLLMDESQNAAGSGNTGAYFQSILKDARAVTFASATFAKRPDTMPLYAIRTAISKAKVKTWELLQMITKGGVTLQEIMSRAMTTAGQMVRRERDMSDVRTEWKTISDPETAQKARRDYDNVMRAFNAIIDFQNNYIKPALEAKSAEFAGMAGTITERRGTKNAGVDNPPFVNRLYNFSKQLLLSLKVDAVVNEVLAEIEAGHKPVIALENTLESALDEYGVGDVIDDPTLYGKLKKGLDACFRYTLKDEDGNEMGGELQPHELGDEGEQAYNELVDLIEESTRGMFISPLDAITEKLQAKGVKVGEISGRKTRAVKNANGDYEVKKRENTDRKKLARDFNSGNLDVLIINKTGSTGISLHASNRFVDQRQRTMIMAQPLSDINDYMQMIGRIDRTGQVHRGYYINLSLPVPAETRFMMMLANKLKSLNANTTTSQENKDNDVDAPDLLNKYGDQVMIEYLRDNPDIYRKLGEFLKGKAEPGAQTVTADKLDEYKAKEGDARQITGRVALLSVDEQDVFYDDVTRRYNELIKYLNDTNSNDLKITVMPLRARTIGKQVSSEGTAPNSNNPFADNAYVEWVEMDILKKPMKAEEVGKTIDQLNPEVERDLGNVGQIGSGKTRAQERQDERLTPRVKQIIATVERETQEKLGKENERYETAKARAEEDIAKKAEVINAQEKRTQQQKDEAIMKYADDKRQAVEESHSNMVDKIKTNRNRLVNSLKMFTVGDSVLIPDDLTTDAFFGSVNGIFCGFKAKNENVTQSTTLAVFCTLDGRRKIEVKLSDGLALVRIDRLTQDNWDAAHQVTLSNWDSQIPTSSRKHGYIMTGNILQAISDNNFQGQLVTFTDDKGNVRDGILMPDKWNPGQLKSATVPISARKERIMTLPMKEHVTSADGRVTLTRYYGFYYLDVPKSKKQGGEFYLDKGLLDLVEDNDFFTVSGKMRARVDNANIGKVIDRLGEMSVTLPSDKNVEFANQEEINTPDPMDAINRAANSWRGSAKESESTLRQPSDAVESDNNSVPLERRTLKSYTDKDGNYHKGIEEELGELDAEISRLGRGEDAASSGEVGQAHGLRQRRRGINDLRREAAKIRAEISSRNRNKENLRSKYNVDAKGNVALEDVRRMFNDLNSNKVLGKLFDKVFDILQTLGTQFRFTDNFDGKTTGEAFGYYNTTFLSWDAFTRDRTDQQKAKTILHEMIHNVAFQLLDRYEDKSKPKLSAAQEKIAKQIFAIYDVVKKANPKNEDGKEPYGLTNAHEMLSEIANPEFRELLDQIPYSDGKSVWQQVKEWFKDLLRSFGLDVKGNTALDSLEKALDDILDNYDEAGVREYNSIRSEAEQSVRDAGYNGDIADLLENAFLANGGGTASVIEDEELIKRLEAEPKITTYRAMKKINGGYYAPMATMDSKTKKLGERSEVGVWMQSNEAPEKAIMKTNDKGEEVWYFRLQKSEKSGDYVDARYNPYIHSSTTMLNDQFKSAETHPDLVVVELEIPESELTSGYKAEKAKDSVGMLPWKAGTIQGQLTGTRQVMLSRYAKIKREVPLDEYAKHVAGLVKGQVEVFPSGIVTPAQRKALEAEGIKFVKTNGQLIIQEGEHKGENYEKLFAKKADKPKKKKAKKQNPVEGDPMDAITKAASKWARGKAEEEGATPLEHSAKAVYNERLNRVETVFSEAYQDSMVSLKTAQNAIAQDKEIPDSQNAYMAENLMHGKNKNEQDLYNAEYRDPLIRTINKIMDATGMNWGDVDRYVYTKSGLERNREFFVRDWLEGERNKHIRKYEDLDPAAQDIFDQMAARIEEDFEDGTITEEQKQKKLTTALQRAHQQYLDDFEADYSQVKDFRYLDLLDGTINFSEYLAAVDDFIRRNIDAGFDPNKHDYSGFRAMFGDEKGKYDEADIIEELMDIEDAINDGDTIAGQPTKTTDTLWNQINKATRYGLDRYREAGMRSDEQLDRVEQMFHWYVPMRGFAAETGEDMYQYFTGKGKAKSYVGGLLKHAKGRGSEASYPISTIFAMSYKAIADCNQNMVNQKFYRLCQANENDLVILSDSWAVQNPTTGEWHEAAPDITDDMSEDEIREATLAWEEEMQALATQGVARKIKGREHFDYTPIDPKNRSEHIVDVRINGQPRKIIVTGNPRMAQALNGQLRFEHGKNVFSQWNSFIKNKMATYFTSYSPTFALRNMFRDWTHFRTMLGVREGQGYARQANKYYRKSLFKMVGLFKKYREGTLNENNEMERDFKDFMDNGGVTGFVFMQKIDDIQKEMESIYKKQKAGKPIRLNNNLWEKVLGAVEAVNEGIENNARFATYRASRHYAGRTKARSAYDAKEITVNFNRKGAGAKTAGFKSQNKVVEDTAKAFGVTSQILGEGRIFFNATVQAIATTFKNFQKPDGSLNKGYIAKWTALYALPPFMFGMALPVINKALAAAFGGDGDDDPYANLAEWTRRRNICIYIGNNNFITIPIGQELAAFLTLGDIVAGYIKPNLKPVDKDLGDELIDVMNTFSPVDISTKITKGGITEDPLSEVVGRTFSVLAPIVAVEQNLGWTGRPIYREDVYPNDKYSPEYQMVYQSTNPVLVGASKAINSLSGGDDVTRGRIQVNPAIVQYLWEQYTGGPGKVFSNTISIGKDAKDLLTGNETDFNIRKVEGVKAFVQQGDDRTAYYRTQAKYRKYKADADELEYQVSGYQKAAVDDPMAMIRLEEIVKGEDFVRMQIVKEADKSLSQINKAANKAEGAEKKELRRLYNEQLAEVVRLLDSVGE